MFTIARIGVQINQNTHYRLGRLMEALKLGHADGSYLKQLSQLQKLDLLILVRISVNPISDSGVIRSPANRSFS